MIQALTKGALTLVGVIPTLLLAIGLTRAASKYMKQMSSATYPQSTRDQAKACSAWRYSVMAMFS
jgi:hypothetical protein